MITLIVGRPGSGKTLYAIEQVLFNEKYKYIFVNFVIYPYYINIYNNVFTNLRKFERIYFFDDERFEQVIEYIKDIAKDENIGENEILVIIDEAIFFINKRFSQKKSIIEFLTKHRKLKAHVMLISQTKKSLLPEVRDFVDRYIIIRYFREAFWIDIPYLRLVYTKNSMDDLFYFYPWFVKPFLFRMYNSYLWNIELSGIVNSLEYLKKNEKWKKIIEKYESESALDTRQGGSNARAPQKTFFGSS